MNWNQIGTKWNQVKESVRAVWGKLKDDDTDQIKGSRNQFAEKLQKRYGLAKDEARKMADEWLQAQPA